MADLEFGFCHGDFKGGNACESDGSFTFFDFDCSGWGYRAYDLAVFPWAFAIDECTSERIEAMGRSFLGGYMRHRKVSDNDIDVIPAFVAIREIWLLGLHIDLGNQFGWGLTNDGKQIYMSDGSSEIRLWDPVSLKETKRITVKDGTQPVTDVNELEAVKGEIFANVWHMDRIARISPADGRVLGWIDLTGLLAKAERPDPEAVLNGIAYDSGADRLFVTGKLWPKVFEIKVVPKK